MNDKAASVPPAPSLANGDPASFAPVWHLGWAVGALAAGAALLMVTGALTSSAALALGLGALPGLAGYFWKPAGRQRLALLALWTVAVVAAATITGGATGPLALWCFAPLLAGVLMAAPAEGAVLAAAAVMVLLLMEFAGVAPAAPEDAFGVGLAAAGLFTLGGATATVLGLLVRQAREDRAVAGVQGADAAAEAEQAAALSAALTQVSILQRKLKTTELARNQALNALGAAQAARAAAEAAREEAEAGANAKSRFLANMSHELRTPLNAIMGFSDIMRQRMFGALTGKYGEYAELIHESGRHLTDLINDVLDMSKIEAERYTLDLDLFDARDPVSGALRLVRLQADDAGVTLRGVLPQTPLMVDADRRALKQIVLNLVSNALKFTPARGSITVTLQAVEGAMELVVADTGVGIAREDLERLGRPYEQAGDAEHKAQGTGLGLSLVRAFARLHGGDMTIESELGEGAAVIVRLPVLHVEAAAAPASQPAPPPPLFAGTEAQLSTTVIQAVEAARQTMDGDSTQARAIPPPRSAEVIPLNLQR